jgi:hypothetical protein
MTAVQRRMGPPTWNPAPRLLEALDLFLHVAQLVLAEVHFLPDEERRRTEGAPREGLLGICHQRLLDFRVIDARLEAGAIQARGVERRCRKPR